jgi:alcohol dehydrogenase
MKAAQINQYGGPDVIKVTTDVEKPKPVAGQVLVEVKAVSLNPFDTTVREGHVQQMIKSLPVTLGGDITGVIVEVSEDVSEFKVGDEIYGQASAVAGNSGAFAEFAATKAAQIALKPKNVDFKVAAALPLVGVSALQAITEHIGLKSGQKILIHGGTGAIGSLAAQLAKHIGAYVAATVSTEDKEYAKSLRIDEVIDFRTQKFEEIIRDYDAVFDTAGGDNLERSLHVLKKGGMAVSMTSDIDEAKALNLGLTVIHQATKVNLERLNKLTELVETGVLNVKIGQVFPLDKVKEAFEARESGMSGKIVLAI